MKNKLINHIWNIMLKRHNILPTRTSFFISSAGKIESVKELKMKLFEYSCFAADDSHVKIIWLYLVVLTEYILHF